jgi:hypothetical protein
LIKVAAGMTNLSQSQIKRVWESDKLVSFTDGKSRLISVPSIYAWMRGRVIACNQVNQPRPKVRGFIGVRPTKAQYAALKARRAAAKAAE